MRPHVFFIRAGLVLAASLADRPACALGAYADESSCVSCHADKTTQYHQSAHARTTSWPSDETIKGNFTPGANTMETSDPNLIFRMEKIGDAFFETAILTTSERRLRRRERIDLVVGSGRKGQTYLYWDKDLLYELPVSCWVQTGTWMNSPGYPDGTALFQRGASDRCLECHATSFEARQPPRNRFVRDSVVPGISCQKCHGPAAEHVSAMQAGAARAPGETPIINPAKLSRERQMDLCSLCHAGVGQALAPTLSYTAGDILAQYLVITPGDPAKPIDPHGSQVQGLTTSRCYRESETFTCLTCHDVHQPQRQAADYAAKCIACHQPAACGEFTRRGPEIADKCVSCHMPLETTAKIVMRLNGERHQPQVRSHRISVPATATP